MWGTAWLVAIVVATVLMATAVPAFAQSSSTPVQEPSPPPDAATRELSLFGSSFTLSPQNKSALESWFAGVDITCLGCGAFDPRAVRPEPTSPNAPWVLQGKWRRQTAFGAVSAGVVGVRNFAVPLSTGTPIGGDFDPGPLGASSAGFVGPTSQWSLTASYEKTLATFKSGASIGAVADVSLPINTRSAVDGDPRISSMASRTIRAGIIIRW